MNAETKEASIIPEWLRHVDLFDSLDHKMLEKLAGEFILERFKPNETVFKQGDQDKKFYVLVAGRVEVIQHSIEGTEIVAILPAEIQSELFAKTYERLTPEQKKMCSVP